MITQARIRKLFYYDPDTGGFTRRIYVSSNARVGDIAGSIDTHGHRQITIRKRLYLAHRLAWFYTYGVWPKTQLDHINGDRDDNRLANLREATNAENCRNTKTRVDSPSGIKGVSWNAQCKKWVAQIQMNKVKRYLGMFSTPEEASAAYEAKAKELFGAFYRPQSLSASSEAE